MSCGFLSTIVPIQQLMCAWDMGHMNMNMNSPERRQAIPSHRDGHRDPVYAGRAAVARVCDASSALELPPGREGGVEQRRVRDIFQPFFSFQRNPHVS